MFHRSGMAPLKLYSTNLSGPVRSVYLTANALGIELELIEISMFNKDHLKPEFIKINPQHTIPVLDDQGTIIWDSHAINTYLVTKYGKDDDPLYPKDPVKRAVVDQRLHFDSGVLFANLVAMLRPMIYRGEKTIPQYYIDEANQAYEFLNIFLAGHRWIAGDNITVADFSALATVTSLDCLVTINAKKYPNVITWIKRAQELPYYSVNQKGVGDFHAFVQKLMS